MASSVAAPVWGSPILPYPPRSAPGNWPSSAFLFITEFESLLENTLAGRGAPVRCPSLADQAVAFGAFSAVSQPFSPQTRIERLHSNAIVCVKVGSRAPVAVPLGLGGATARMVAGQTEYFAVRPGDAVAVITSS